MEEQFKVKTEHFEGPLDLLLSLIEKRKLFINDISLAKVTDDYISHVKSYENFPVDQSANFILIASTLLLIKSRSLLPALKLTEDEEKNIEDLQNRLKIYQRMKELSSNVKKMYGSNLIFAKSETKNIQTVFSPDKETNVSKLLSTIREVLKNLPKKEILPKVLVRKVISLEETIEKLTGRIKTSLRMSFKNFSGFGKEEKVNVIVSFLAMLELVKNGIINVMQQSKHGDIEMETQEIGVPKYH
ncbi:MAG: ScpA family protein [Candidatus Paceibacterota bacterium]